MADKHNGGQLAPLLHNVRFEWFHRTQTREPSHAIPLIKYDAKPFILFVGRIRLLILFDVIDIVLFC